ncbi:SET domain-containing protein [Rhizopogon vinicolor AM-OR11-026]|uniref:SET domain-containing protein n=1 Tax=Rhizopogon vinicolor AM-OR11-026 TaxID=1314800 RepID=A0A1B7MZW9_9AGAM|nr:SET domain-containing protein [Rhizopogon vinicolor AM-OR11-026]
MPSSLDELPAHVRLESHPTACNKAVAVSNVSPGSVILDVPSMVVLLLPSGKGHRCDFCLCSEASTVRLARCAGCASYWYCGTQCQSLHWGSHKKYCKRLASFTASADFQCLEEHEKLAALLHTHLIAEISSNVLCDARAKQLSTFMSLLPGPQHGSPPIACPMSVSVEVHQSLEALFSRSGNNNFAVHSHLTTIAHGIFPLASRLFNHSCLPNAAARYVIRQGQPVHMEVVALRQINASEEICISYVDPALIESRQQITHFTYGFSCTCPSCNFINTIGAIPPLPVSEAALADLDNALQRFCIPSGDIDDHTLLAGSALQVLPKNLHCVLHEGYLSRLTDTFSESSHEGSYRVALNVGLSVFAMYLLIYPTNYPQIGMHLLEMAKTAWNAVIAADHDNEQDVPAKTSLLKRAQIYLDLSSKIIKVFGSEGDPGGPLEELAVLENLLREDERSQLPVRKAWYDQ